jgi:plastocyanin
VRGTGVERLGTVGSLKTETFVFPFRRLGAGESRLRAYPIGGPAAFTSENLYVQPGQMVKWTLEADLTRSFLGVY